MTEKRVPFDLGKALAGARVVTRDGMDVTGLRRNSRPEYSPYAIAGLVDNKRVRHWHTDGCYSRIGEHIFDLFLLEEPKSEGFDCSKLKVGDRVRLRDGFIGGRIAAFLVGAERPIKVHSVVGVWSVYPDGRRNKEVESQFDIIGLADEVPAVAAQPEDAAPEPCPVVDDTPQMIDPPEHTPSDIAGLAARPTLVIEPPMRRIFPAFGVVHDQCKADGRTVDFARFPRSEE